MPRISRWHDMYAFLCACSLALLPSLSAASPAGFAEASAYKAKMRTTVGQRPDNSQGVGVDLNSMLMEAMSIRQNGAPRFNRIYVDGVDRDLGSEGRTMTLRDFMFDTVLNDTHECRRLNNQLNTQIYAHLAGTDAQGLNRAYNEAEADDVSFRNPLSGLAVSDRNSPNVRPSELNFTARWKSTADTVDVTLYAWGGEGDGQKEWTTERSLRFPIRNFDPTSQKCLTAPVLAGVKSCRWLEKGRPEGKHSANANVFIGSMECQPLINAGENESTPPAPLQVKRISCHENFAAEGKEQECLKDSFMGAAGTFIEGRPMDSGGHPEWEASWRRSHALER
ncbi:MAG: hypothetical protein ABIJ96_15020 [Elusimicrobiota bacterium]